MKPPPLSETLRSLRTSLRAGRALLPSVRRISGRPGVVLHDGLLWTVRDTLTPLEAMEANEALVTRLLDAAGVRWIRVRNAEPFRATIAISEVDRPLLQAALADQLHEEPVYIQRLEEGRSATRSKPMSPARLVSTVGVLEARVVRIGRLYSAAEGRVRYDLSRGCDLELWRPVRGGSEWLLPRPSAVGTVVPDQMVGLASALPDESVFDVPQIDDITFPIDVVYTWVDGADPQWREKLNQHRLRAGYHAEATSPSRFHSRDELRYSLRSLFMYAPWVRHVYLVTDEQVPEYLDTNHPKITVVDHKDLAPDPSVLPVFSSNAITTWLHRIPGLSEHYLYLNDDMFFGRLVAPHRFFDPSGICRVFPGNSVRPFGPTDPADLPHINLSRNIRTLIEEASGKTFTHAIKHTPYPQRVSVHQEMEERFREVYERTARHRFRHHDDIAGDQLFHYYARVTGRAVVGSIRYEYVNVNSDASIAVLERLEDRSVDVFCLNEGPAEGEGVPETMLRSFLERRFPMRSPVELAEPGQRS